MKTSGWLLVILLLFPLAGNSLHAQIALNYTDTTICPGETIEMCATLTGHADELNSDDQYSGIINIGFPFEFFGNTYTKCVASGNGFITFDTTLAYPSGGPWYWGQIPNQQRNCIFAAFADLYLPNGGKIRYQHFGSPGSRRFIIEWCHLPFFVGSPCAGLIATTQIILYEGTNVIEVHTTELPAITPPCPTASPDNRVVQGVEDITGAFSFFPVNKDPSGPLAANWGNTGATNDAARFTPVGGPGGITYNIDTIPFSPWIIIDSLSSADLKWYAPDQPNIPIATGACVTVTPDGSQDFYLVKFNGNAGCENELVNLVDTVHIHYGTAYDTIAATICQGETYPFFGKQLYLTGQYDTLFTSEMGCDSFITLLLTVNPLPDVTIHGFKNLELCDGDSVRVALDNPEASSTYQWSRDGSPVAGAVDPEIILHDEGNYRVTATTDKGCVAVSDNIKLTVNPNPTAEIMPFDNEIICAYDTAALSAVAGANYDYRWSPEKPFRAVAGPEGRMVKGIFTGPTLVILTVNNEYGCHDSASVMINTKPCCDVFVPSAFTPNGDGINDFFKPHLQLGQLLIWMKIFNRNGQLVYDNTRPETGWDGYFDNGKPAPVDTYMYYMEYTCSDGKVYHKKESLTLVR